MQKNNFFITKKTKDQLAKQANEIVPITVRQKYAELRDKYNAHFSQSKKENAQLLWQLAIDDQDMLPPDNAWRQRREVLGEWIRRKSSQENILAYMDYAGMLEDWNYLRNLETYELTVFVNHELPEYGIRPSMRNLLECQDYDLYFSQFLIENCDSKTLDKAADMKKAFDTLLKGLDAQQSRALADVFNCYVGSDREFGTIHNMLNPQI